MAEDPAAKDVSLAGGTSGADVSAGYNTTEAGVIPDMQQLSGKKARLPDFSGEWVEKRLGDVATFVRGRGLSKADISQNGMKPCIHYGELFRNYGERITAVMHGTDLDGEFVRSVTNDVLMPTSDVTPNGLATASCIQQSDIILGGGILIIRIPEDVIDGVFLAYSIRHHRNQIMGLVTGTTVFHLYGHDMAKFNFPVPNLEEQRAVAEALSNVDGLIESLEALIDKKRAVKTAAMQQLLTGRTRLPGFSGEWQTRQVLDVADVDPENLSNDTKPDFAFNYISLEQVVSGRLLGYSEEKFCTAPSRARRVLRYRDVLMSTVRPGLMAHLLYRDQIPNAICSTGFAVLRPKTKLCDPGFLFSHLLGHVVNRQIQNALAGSNYPAISGRDVGRLEIPFPSRIQEQRAIAAALSDMDAEIGALERRLDKARAIKQGMMQQLLTGRIRLPATDGIAKGRAESAEAEPVGAAPKSGVET